MTRRRLILASLLAAWMSMVIACGGGGNYESRPGTGEEGYLYLPDNDTQDLLVAVDEEALDRLIEASVKHDQFGVAEVALTGTFSTSARTKVLILNPGITKTQVRILSGPKTGESGFVPSEWVHKAQPTEHVEPAPAKAQTEEEPKADKERQAKQRQLEEAKDSNPKVKGIAYEILDKEGYDRKDGKCFLAILVDESVSKEEVLQLAHNLRRHYDGQYAAITIYDSREAWQIEKKWFRVAAGHLQGEKETLADRVLEKEFEKQRDEHVLVIIVPPDDAAAVGLEEIRWAEGALTRQHQREAAKKAAEAKAREARAEASRKAQPQARKEADRQHAEDRAAADLKHARKLAIKGEVAKAKERLRLILKETPQTNAAQEAKQLLDTLNDLYK